MSQLPLNRGRSKGGGGGGGGGGGPGGSVPPFLRVFCLILIQTALSKWLDPLLKIIPLDPRGPCKIPGSAPAENDHLLYYASWHTLWPHHALTPHPYQTREKLVIEVS